MKRLCRWLLNGLTVLSLLLCLGLVATITRSYWVLDQWNRFQHTQYWSVELEKGHLFLVHARGEIDHGQYDAYRPRPAGRSLPPPWSPYASGSSTAQQFANGQSGPLTLDHQRISLWYIAALAAILPTIRAARRFPWRQWLGERPPGSCRSCGYDLRATPDRCPECGLVPSPQPV